ncbi:hypothetical protein POX_d05237 [Penicillium oxalicum]|uniref:hypothetical protein n=1 Tax=Penicillium oxalicum TaxID=69781 RepID=UPI0020B88DA6|nr:hypothetical protein POX_d05237 [Penicillium oxalicum]KAI2789740.1 hypothetical protein POX_d05237 [Penicillium oxalicum]
MSDPFSAAASAVGIISLGLQVTQQLVAFCQAFQSYDEDVRRVEAKAQSLRRPLRALRDIIEDAQLTNPELAGDLADKALGLQRMVHRLKASVDGDPLIQLIPGGWSGVPFAEKLVSEKMRGRLKKVVHPFRKDGLRDLFADLDGIQNALQTTLSFARSCNGETDDRAECRSCRHSVQKMTRLGMMQEAILEEVQQIRVTLQEYPQGMPPPGLLRSWCDSQSYFSTMSITEMPSEEDMQTESKSETALQLTDESMTDLDSVTVSSTNSCRAWIFTNRNYGVLFAFQRRRWVLDSAFLESVRAIVKYHGSTLNLHSTKVNNREAARRDDFEEVVNNSIRQIQLAFSTGKSRPTDIFYYDLVPDDYNMVSFVDGLVNFDLMTSRNQLPVLERLARFLIESGSVPQNRLNHGALRELLRFGRFGDEEYRLASYLVEHGGPCVLHWDGSLSLVEKFNVKYIVARSTEIITVPDTARILLQESEEELLTGLKSGSIDPHEKVCGTSLLRLAFGWPRGIQILLEAGAHVGHGSLISFWGCPSPLVESDIDFDAFFHSTRLLLEGGCRIRLSTVQVPRSGRLQSLFISVFANRRKRLGRIARSCLPQDVLQELDIREGAVVDLHASRVCELLAARGRSVEWSLWADEKDASVYHNPYLHPDFMQKLLDAGFEDFDSPDSKGVTPLMVNSQSVTSAEKSLERMAWLGSKGADQTYQLPSSRARVAHLLTAQIVGLLLKTLEFWNTETVDFDWSSLVRTISQNRTNLFPCHLIKDTCVCDCSTQGCTVVSVAMRQVLRWSRWREMPSCSTWLKRLMSCIVEWAQHDKWAELAVIRVLTFDAVGLKHSCCIEIDCLRNTNTSQGVHDLVGRDHEEIYEIRAENSYQLDLFNLLITHFELKYNELGLPLMDFVEGYWYPYILAHLLTWDPFSEEHNQATREIGVVLHPEEPDLSQVSLLLCNASPHIRCGDDSFMLAPNFHSDSSSLTCP